MPKLGGISQVTILLQLGVTGHNIVQMVIKPSLKGRYGRLLLFLGIDVRDLLVPTPVKRRM